MSSPSSGVASIPEKVDKVRRYFATHVTKSYEWRKKQLTALRSLLLDNEDAIVAALAADLRRPSFEAAALEVHMLAAEIDKVTSQLAGWMKPEHVASPLTVAPASSYVVREPYGVVLIIGPFNYPVQLLVLPLCAALCAGNCAVVKPSELTPNVSSLLSSLIPRYMDPSGVTCIEGGVPETTALLKEHFDFIFFTGSLTVGKIVMRAAAEHLTPVCLELGGKTPVIVDQGADLKLAARRVAWGKLLNAGQTCTAPDYCFVAAEVKDAFLSNLAQAVETMFGREPQASPDLSRIVSSRHTQRLQSILDEHKADIVLGGKVDVEEKYVSPTVLSLPSPRGRAMEEELFGPILPVIPYTSLDAVIAYINSKPKPLGVYLFSPSSSVQQRVINETSSGAVVINDVMMQSANKDLPFGGVGASGMGSYHGKWGFLTLSHAKAVLHRSEWGDAPQRYPPYTLQNLKFYKFIIPLWQIDQDKLIMAGKITIAAAAIAVVGRLAVSRW